MSRRVRGARDLRPWIIGGVVGGIAVLLLLFLLVQPMLSSNAQIAADPTTVARVALRSMPNGQGTAVDVVFQDRAGRDVPLTGQLAMEVREPDGQRWEHTRDTGAGDFTTLPGDSLLAGRLGYRAVIPTNAWARAPRHGGQAQIGVVATVASSGERISSTSSEVFP